MCYIHIKENEMKKIFSGSMRMKTQATMKQNKWDQGSYFNKQVNRMMKGGLTFSQAQNKAELMRTW